MLIRPARRSECSQTATLSVAAFRDDELYRYLDPYQDQYPAHYRDYFLRRHKLRFVTPEYHFFVATLEEGDEGYEAGDEAEQVVGYSMWSRKGESDVAKRWNRKQTWAECEYSQHSSSIICSLLTISYEI